MKYAKMKIYEARASFVALNCIRGMVLREWHLRRARRGPRDPGEAHGLIFADARQQTRSSTAARSTKSPTSAAAKGRAISVFASRAPI